MALEGGRRLILFSSRIQRFGESTVRRKNSDTQLFPIPLAANKRYCNAPSAVTRFESRPRRCFSQATAACAHSHLLATKVHIANGAFRSRALLALRAHHEHLRGLVASHIHSDGATALLAIEHHQSRARVRGTKGWGCDESGMVRRSSAHASSANARAQGCGPVTTRSRRGPNTEPLGQESTRRRR